VKNYLAQTAGGGILPNSREEIEILLNALLLEKAIYELGYELNNRPDWIKIPICGIQQLLQTS
jgi:maltose alpha-D-glucosyltransferase / alpha-amylase